MPKDKHWNKLINGESHAMGIRVTAQLTTFMNGDSRIHLLIVLEMLPWCQEGAGIVLSRQDDNFYHKVCQDGMETARKVCMRGLE